MTVTAMARENKMKAALTGMLTGGRIILATGDRGGGKTHLTMVLADWFLYQGGHVLSNVIIYKKSEGTIWDDQEGYPQNYHKVTTLAQIFTILSDIWQTDPEAKVLIILDEAAVSLEAQSFQAFLSREVVKVGTLIRKFRAALILISIRPELVLKKLRSEEGLLDIRLAKEPLLMRRYAADQLYAKREIRELVLVEWQERGLDFVPVHVPMTKRLALPREYCNVGGYFFDTLGAASFDSGVHPITGKDFMFKELLAVLGTKPSNMYPRLLYRFMHEDPTPLLAEALVSRSSGILGDAALPDADAGGGANAPVGEFERMYRKRQVAEMLRDHRTWTNAMIARDCDVSREYVRQVRKEMHEKGEDEVLAELDRRDRLDVRAPKSVPPADADDASEPEN